MAKPRDPRRDEAYEIYKSHNGEIKNREIAEQLNVPEKTISNWKSRDKWNDKLSGKQNVVLQKNKCSTTKDECSTTKKKRGGQPDNQNALGNRGGAKKGNRHAVGNRGGGAPLLNGNAVTHGLFRKFLPDDEDTQELMEAINERGPLEMLWDAIVIKHTNIIRSQKILFVQDKDDETRVLVRHKESDMAWEKQWEIQHAWDKQSRALEAYSRAMAELRSLIKEYMLLSGEDDQRRLQLEKMQQSMEVEREKLAIAQEKLALDKARIAGDDEGDVEDDGLMDQLQNASGVWSDYDGSK